MRNISFSISSCMLDTSNQKRSLKPNKDGVYEGLCLMVLGNQPSRNGKIYQPESMLDAITNPDSCCHKQLVDGGLAGEFGHPLILNDNEISRIATIDMSKVSHIIVKVYTGETTEKGNTPIYGDIRPFGPYKDQLIDSLESPVINTAFSLRSLVEKVGQDANGNIIQKVMALVTWDAVNVGGYRAAAKVAPQGAVEGYEIPIEAKADNQLLKTLVSQEVISDHQLEDILGLDKITIMKNTFEVGNKSLLQNGHSVDLFHTMFNH